MTRNDIIQLAAIPPAIHLPDTIQLHPAVQIVDVPEYICTNLLRLNSPPAVPAFAGIVGGRQFAASFAARARLRLVSSFPTPKTAPNFGA